METTLKQIMIILVVCTILVNCKPGAKEIDCTKKLYHVNCRGAFAKRDTRRLDEMFENQRYLEEPSSAEFDSKSNEYMSMRLLDTLIKKINSRNTDYDTGTNNYIH